MKKQFILLCSIAFNTIATAHSDSLYSGRAGIADVDDSDPGLFMFMMFFLVLFVAAFVLLTIIAIAAAIILSVLVFAGVVSISAIAGIYQRSFTAGFRWLFVLCAGIATAIAGIPIALLMNAFFKTSLSLPIAVCADVSIGLVTGLAADRILFFLLQKAARKYKTKWFL